jgi:hypothetical protein
VRVSPISAFVGKFLTGFDADLRNNLTIRPQPFEEDAVGLFSNLLSRSESRPKSPTGASIQPLAPSVVEVDGLAPFPLLSHMSRHRGLPIVEWTAVQHWLADSVPEELRAAAWACCERAWLLHFREALGPTFHLREGNTAAIVSSLDPKLAQVTLDYVERTLKRIGSVLHGIAKSPEWCKDFLIVFDDADRYYDYVSYYYPDSGEFAFSGGMYIGAACSHFVTVKTDVRSIEPVIAHEMTHACLSHLPIPAWLNEGLAVNTEARLVGRRSGIYTVEEMYEKHIDFWNESTIQEFWSGKSFLRSDDGNMLSYDLACILVDQFSKDWETFTGFVLAANRSDGGGLSAREHLQFDLGAAVAALLQKEHSSKWEPDPAQWEGEPERGAFYEIAGLLRQK